MNAVAGKDFPIPIGVLKSALALLRAVHDLRSRTLVFARHFLKYINWHEHMGGVRLSSGHGHQLVTGP
ncbi:hypothetical protein F8388_016972 [Cannabis sativa]|uniref:Uncharacterized protein n=1 Tax=Cannabis sativa TaxID=3483 RepID=A0A7J6E3Y0_CANSA|nr:hypothetical protein F8388_016972 [Cannabis sativa]